ncbi:hypothetical protein [Gemmata sp.]|uniref:hypothetical protein n=1 Tax=Gemmata sp. TaxID=1914242 RepID=UPI003F717A55
MTATATMTNGKPARKQLADQLDRLDGIIDCIADRLPEAVADATREGARQAVRDVILELLTNPELRTLIAGLAPAAQPAVAPEPSATPAPSSVAGPAKSEFWGRVREKCTAAKDATVRKCRAAKAAVVNTARTLSAIMPLKQMLAVGAGVGVAVAAVSYACPHTVSAAVSGVCGAATAVAVQVGRWFRRSAGLFGFGQG